MSSQSSTNWLSLPLWIFMKGSAQLKKLMNCRSSPCVCFVMLVFGVRGRQSQVVRSFVSVKSTNRRTLHPPTKNTYTHSHCTRATEYTNAQTYNETNLEEVVVPGVEFGVRRAGLAGRLPCVH